MRNILQYILYDVNCLTYGINIWYSYVSIGNTLRTERTCQNKLIATEPWIAEASHSGETVKTEWNQCQLVLVEITCTSTRRNAKKRLNNNCPYFYLNWEIWRIAWVNIHCEGWFDEHPSRCKRNSWKNIFECRVISHLFEKSVLVNWRVESRFCQIL